MLRQITAMLLAMAFAAIGRDEGASGVLSMRATETRVRAFEQGVHDGPKPFGASVYATNRNAEELTAQIVDNEARLRSMTAHRDALQKMVEDKPGRLSDLLEIQQALAQAQGDIGSRQLLLAALKLRVSMSVITFDYRAEYAAAAQSIWRPVTDALGDFSPVFARTLGAIIAFVAALLPLVVFVLLSLAVLIFLFRWAGRRRASKAERLMAMEKATSSASS
jgi:cbb3-type cytochrome oxidase subunit 3